MDYLFLKVLNIVFTFYFFVFLFSGSCIKHEHERGLLGGLISVPLLIVLYVLFSFIVSNNTRFIVIFSTALGLIFALIFSGVAAPSREDSDHARACGILMFLMGLSATYIANSPEYAVKFSFVVEYMKLLGAVSSSIGTALLLLITQENNKVNELPKWLDNLYENIKS